jgi:hypothetical protein
MLFIIAVPCRFSTRQSRGVVTGYSSLRQETVTSRTCMFGVYQRLVDTSEHHWAALAGRDGYERLLRQ